MLQRELKCLWVWSSWSMYPISIHFSALDLAFNFNTFIEWTAANITFRDISVKWILESASCILHSEFVHCTHWNWALKLHYLSETKPNWDFAKISLWTCLLFLFTLITTILAVSQNAVRCLIRAQTVSYSSALLTVNKFYCEQHSCSTRQRNDEVQLIETRVALIAKALPLRMSVVCLPNLWDNQNAIDTAHFRLLHL